MKEITDLATAQRFLSTLADPDTGEIVALTGAGISTESGIPDFRSPGGIWSKLEPIQYQDFVTDEQSRLEDWRRRFEMQEYFRKASPNPAHRALAGLSGMDRLTRLITQNVDGLQQVAGTDTARLVELHGNATYAHCLECDRRAELDSQRDAVRQRRSPICDACGGLLKAAVISFGEMMPEAALCEAATAAQAADLFLVIGSSLVVHPAAQLPVLAVRAGARLVIVNREETPLDVLAETIIRTPIGESFAKLAENVGGKPKIGCG